MGSYAVYSCTQCKKKIELGGPEEFRKNWLGKRVPEPHIGGKKVNGLWIVLWCPTCQRVEKKVMIEFSRTCTPLEVWNRTAPVKPEYSVDDPNRYKCIEDGTFMLDSIPIGTKCSCGGTIEKTDTIRT